MSQTCRRASVMKSLLEGEISFTVLQVSWPPSFKFFVLGYLVQWGGVGGFECVSSFIRYLTLMSWVTSCTAGIPRYTWIIPLVTYMGRKQMLVVF